MSRKWQTKKEMLQFSSKSFQSLAFHHFTRQGVPQPRADRTEWPVTDRHETRPWNDQVVRWRWSQTSPAGYVGDASQVIREVAQCQAAQRSERQSRQLELNVTFSNWTLKYCRQPAVTVTNYGLISWTTGPLLWFILLIGFWLSWLS